MKMIILCGGLGTRLRTVIYDKQKTMVDIKGIPFLQLIIDKYKMQGIKDFIFTCGYKASDIYNYFNDGSEYDINIKYCYEDIPLGTAGAIKNCINCFDDDYIYIVNGDTYFDVDIHSLYNNFIKYKSVMAILLRKIENVERYGSVSIDGVNEGIIINFEEKTKENSEMIINAGIYLIKREIILTIPDGNYSIERDIIPNWIKEKKVLSGIVAEGNFYDIGIPESLKNFINNL